MALLIVILGAGISGLTSALALHKELPDPKPAITVLEIRPAPSTIGGAVNLTPKALRYLDYLGVLQILRGHGYGAECKSIELFDLYSGAKNSEIDFRGAGGTGIGKAREKQHFALRVMRQHLQKALLEAVEAVSNSKVMYGKKVTRITESVTEGIELAFEDGTTINCDLLLGCDGIHSAARTILVDPEREETYTGISVVMATSKVRSPTQLRWRTTGLTSSRRGSFMATYFEPTSNEQYIAGVMEIADVANREGWQLLGSDQGRIKEDLLDRFKCSNMPELEELITDAGDWSLYPVYKLGPQGKWVSPHGRCILIGDAAHAMAPQGESTGICIEDAIVFSRAMIHHKNHPLTSIFGAYEKLRRPQIDEAWTSSSRRWETVKDSGWLAYQLKHYLTPWFVWWTAKSREEEFAIDYSDLNIHVG